MWRWFCQTDIDTARSLSSDLRIPLDQIVQYNRDQLESRGAREGRVLRQIEEAEAEQEAEEIRAAVALVEGVSAFASRRMGPQAFAHCFWADIRGRGKWNAPPGRVRHSVRDDIRRTIYEVRKEPSIKILLVTYAKIRYFWAS
jgi:hypothetical protein